VLDAVARPFELSSHRIHVTASVGVAVYPDDSADASALLRHADMAMYRAKELGKNAWQVYSKALRDTMAARLQIEQALRDGIVRGQLFLVYQPKLELSGGRVVGLEALVRWRHPARGIVSPAEFVPVAEKTDLIVELGAWVLEAACAQMARWRSQGLSLPVSINVSTRHFAHGTLVAAVEDALLRHRLPAELLELEITEGAMMSDVEQAQQQLLELDALGVAVSIDDFGTGYSSLALLPRLRVDALKIDRSFLASIEREDGESVYRAVLAMAEGLGLRTIAEGVETDAQAAFLRDAGCSQAQGFLFARPLPPEQAGRLAGQAWRGGRWVPDAPRAPVAVGVEGTL
jgi:EAL domain-containing protein (putative c-di-GMP-specific phosphodiesterase class I)